MVGRQSGADLEERLTVPVGKLVEDRPARWIGQCFEHISRQASALNASPTDATIGK